MNSIDDGAEDSMENQHRPLSLLGVSLKKLLAGFVFLSILIVVIKPTDITSFLNQTLSTIQPEKADRNQYDQRDTHIDATPEMISAAIQELRADRMRKYETSESSSPTDRFFYVIELLDGGDLEATSVTIEPDLVTIISESGIKTVVSRTAIKKINRYKLPDTTRATE